MACRYCAECGDWLDSNMYSNNQWNKGDSYSRCMECVGYSQPQPQYKCRQCNNTYNTSNELEMHMQVHRPRTVACPVCGEGRFKSGANAVQHLESGYFTGCRGTDNAREQIYRFASKQKTMNRFMNDVPRLTYDNSDYGQVPDLPYTCRECCKSFRQLSQLLQHQDNKHQQNNLLRY